MRNLMLTIMVLGTACGGSEPLVENGEQSLDEQQCFYGNTKAGNRVAMTKILHSLTAEENGDFVDLRIIFNRDFVDVSYGANAVGWGEAKKGKSKHKFDSLVGSDHTRIALMDADGEAILSAKLDFISQDDDATSGYGSFGFSGGDGKVELGDASDFVKASSSLDDNFNIYGYVLTEDSPETDADYASNPEYPEWNYFVEYRLRVRASAFGAAGFGHPMMQSVHASPSKFEENTVEVVPDDCPPELTPYNPFPPCLQGGCAAKFPGDPDPAHEPDDPPANNFPDDGI